MKILYAGGGTMGSVSPLIAIHQKLVSKYPVPEYQCFWLGTHNGPEKEVVEKVGIKFEVIESGKFRRYFDLKNLLDFFRIIIGFFQALYWCFKFKPDIILTAGSFISVPVAYAAFFYGASVFVHQQDIEVGLANKLMAPVAKKITVALEKSLQDFDSKKVVLVGNPVRLSCSVRSSLPASSVGGPTGMEMYINEHKVSSQETGANNSINDFKFQNNLPTVLILGGGTGAMTINELVWQSLPELIKFCNIIHITGKEKNLNNESGIINYEKKYKNFEFLDEQKIYSAMQVAEVVVTRAGMSALTELAYFKKPTVIIPIADSHQEKNAKYFANHEAAINLSQKNLTKENFVAQIKNLLNDKNRQQEMGENMQQIFIDYSGEKYLEEILK